MTDGSFIKGIGDEIRAFAERTGQSYPDAVRYTICAAVLLIAQSRQTDRMFRRLTGDNDESR